MAPPAGTDVPPSSDTRYFYRRQVYSRNPVTGSNFVGGRTVNFQAEASGGHYLVPSECRIVAKLKVLNTAGTGPNHPVELSSSCRRTTWLKHGSAADRPWPAPPGG